MGYHIRYGETIIKTEIRKAVPKKSGKPTFVIILLCITILSFALREKKDILIRYLLPGDAAVTAVALDTLAENLWEGESVGNAVTAFCKEIIDHADIQR